MKRENLQQYFAILIFIIPLMIGVYLLASKSSPDYKNNLRQLQSTMAFNYTDADVGINSFKSLVETGKIQTVYYNESDFILIAEDKTKKTFTFENT
ncbi:hypothetical protein CLCAR_0520 [Clostridium carboxidivorans P7]|uniref:hypothetical protein n=1 Tax=Clostridium carboxidivorans TaxID=217159 RepID=UPI0001D38F09|nr:hypothetical protein [Clostridium carboxidivorans]EFG89365.1 hypothetical protein CLCAR_0520 [Clostridium carboxidivorans P7]